MVPSLRHEHYKIISNRNTDTESFLIQFIKIENGVKTYNTKYGFKTIITQSGNWAI